MQPHIQRLIIEYRRAATDAKDAACAAKEATTVNEAVGAIVIATEAVERMQRLGVSIIECARIARDDAGAMTLRSEPRAGTNAREVRCLNCGHRWRASSCDTGWCASCGHVGCQPIQEAATAGNAIRKEVPAEPGTPRT